MKQKVSPCYCLHYNNYKPFPINLLPFYLLSFKFNKEGENTVYDVTEKVEKTCCGRKLPDLKRALILDIPLLKASPCVS